jgi:hypothetical protein|tara:strand:+ start:1285 stop:1542 length:258 start_codon:yes stop_codon:yes gene_type:complete
MNILDDNPNSDFNEGANADYIVGESMSALWDLVIEPMQSKLSQEEISVISLIGLTLKMVGNKATAYEKLEAGELEDPKENDFYRN